MDIAPQLKSSNNKRTAILDTLRQRIVAGEWAPGSRLPIRAELEQEFGVSGFTMQRALDQLNRDGFTYGKRRWGTFVAENPPHLSRYGIVFPGRPGNLPVWVRFWTALVNEAANVQESISRQMPVFYGVDGHLDSEDYQRLLQELRHQRLAGLIFPSFPHALTDTPVMLDPGLPRVAIMGPDERGAHITPLVLDWPSFMDKALDYLAARGRRRIAMLMAPSERREFAEQFQRASAARQMETRPYWVQQISQIAPQGAQACVHLLLRGTAEERPDGLIIADDNLVEYAMAGAMDAGVQLGRDVDVVAHCNFPWPAPQGMAIRRLGFDARQLLESSIEIIDRQRRGEGGAGPVSVPAVFEDEIGNQGVTTVRAEVRN